MASGKWNDFVDAVLYINLDHRRADREPALLQQLQVINFPNNKIHRVSAVRMQSNGHKGCALSHIKCLELALKNKWKTVWIVEDDNRWATNGMDTLLHRLNEIPDFLRSQDEWHVFMLGCILISGQKLCDNSDFMRVRSAQTGDSYLVNCEGPFIYTLLANFRDCVQKAPDDNHGRFTTLYALDQTWKLLQGMKSSRWFTRKPFLSHQAGGRSDILSHKPL